MQQRFRIIIFLSQTFVLHLESGIMRSNAKGKEIFMSYSMSLDLQQKQSLKQSQRLMMSPQMQQAIHLLQMPVMELEMAIEAELRNNPVLENDRETDGEEDHFEQEDSRDGNEEQDPEREVVIDDHDFEILKRLDEEYADHFAESGSYSVKRTAEEEKLKTFMESSIKAEESLFDKLMCQAREHFDDSDLAIAEAIIGNLDDNGFFSTPIQEFTLINGFDEEQVLLVLDEIQMFEPPGIAAKNLQKALLIQLRRQRKKNTLAYAIIEKHYNDLLRNRIPLIQRSLDVSALEIQQAVDQDIVPLDLHPAKGFCKQAAQPIIPDATIYEEDGELKVVVSEEFMPSLRFNRRYMRMLEDENLPTETKDYIRQKMMSGKWLLRNIHQRNDTIYKIARSLAKRQRVFFMSPDGKLEPLTMKTVAEELELHESTVARAVANKYVDSPRGLLSLRSFFTNALVTDQGDDISSSTVKDALLEILDAENKKKPLSDDAISKKLKEKGIHCARRTVAKYRTQFGIGNASQRRCYS